MTDSQLPFRTIWIDPHCAKCFEHIRGEITWCDEPAQEECADCGRGPIPYNIDKRSLRKEDKK